MDDFEEFLTSFLKPLRRLIVAQRGVGMSQRQIASELGIHNSTVSRELRRNAAPNGYDPAQAQALSDDRHRTAWKLPDFLCE